MSESLVVNEIFISIQGESTFAGRLCVFVRLTGCNLDCTWCDTRYARSEGESMTVGEVVARVESFGCSLVEVTGGEPLIQPASLELMTRLADRGFSVLLESNGACDISQVDPRVVRIVDVKCPSSGQSERNFWPNLGLVSRRDQVKFVLADRADYQWAREVIGRYAVTDRCEVLFSPVAKALPASELAGWMVADRLAVRLGIQLHKVIWPGVDRGV